MIFACANFGAIFFANFRGLEGNYCLANNGLKGFYCRLIKFIKRGIRYDTFILHFGTSYS